MLDESKLPVVFMEGALPDGPITPRRYTLTHSDLAGDLFLAIGPDYDRKALATLQVRLECDEVLGEWLQVDGELHLSPPMAAQGGFPLFGTGRMRCDIFRRYRPMVLSALRYGDAALLTTHPELDEAPVIARFHWRAGRCEAEPWGRLADWR